MAELSEIKIFAGSSGLGFAQRMCAYLNTTVGQSQVITFSEGNTFVRIGETVRDKDVFLLQPIGLRPNDEFVEILFWMDAFKRASANSVTAIIPYFGYAKGDKKDEPRVSIRARVCAECIELAGADRVVTMDLHAPQVQGFFKKPVDHLLAFPVLCDYIQSMNIPDMIVVSTDAGFAKSARKFADRFKVPVAIGDKARYGHDENAKVLEIIGDVTGKNCVIVDDFSISGGTLCDMARLLKQKGAKKIYAALSHNLLSQAGVCKINESPIEQVIFTDSVDNPVTYNQPKIKVVSVAPLFAEAVYRIHNCISVSPLFKSVPQRVIQSSMF